MSNERSSTVTTGMQVGDTEQTRIPIGRDVMDRTNPSQPAIAGGSTLPGSPSSDSINSGMSIGSQIVLGAIKPVDRRTITGSTPGDFRAPNTGAGITDQFMNAPGPRDPARQFVGSKNETDPPGFQSTVDPSQLGD